VSDLVIKSLNGALLSIHFSEICPLTTLRLEQYGNRPIATLFQLSTSLAWLNAFQAAQRTPAAC